MARARSSQPTPAWIHARIPVALYEAIDAYAEALEVTLSESLRRLVVKGLESMDTQLTILGDNEGLEPSADNSWRHPLTSPESETREHADRPEASSSDVVS